MRFLCTYCLYYQIRWIWKASRSYLFSLQFSCYLICLWYGVKHIWCITDGDALQANSHGHMKPRRLAIFWKEKWRSFPVGQMNQLKLLLVTWLCFPKGWVALGMCLLVWTSTINLNKSNKGCPSWTRNRNFMIWWCSWINENFEMVFSFEDVILFFCFSHAFSPFHLVTQL